MRIVVAGRVGECKRCGFPVDEWEDDKGRYHHCRKCGKNVRLRKFNQDTSTLRLKPRSKRK